MVLSSRLYIHFINKFNISNNICIENNLIYSIGGVVVKLLPKHQECVGPNIKHRHYCKHAITRHTRYYVITIICISP